MQNVNTTTVDLVATSSSVKLSTNEQLDALRDRRATWENGEYKKANETLYILLAETLDLFNSSFTSASNSARKALRDDLKDRLAGNGSKVQKNTTVLSMFVRFIFEIDRKRAHSYSYVLKAAISHGISAQQFPSFIVNNGGIEEVRARMVVSEKALAKKAELALAKETVTQQIEAADIRPLATVQIDGISGEYTILIARPNPNGEVSIVGFLPNVDKVLYNSLLNQMAKVQVKEKSEAEALATEVNDLLAPTPAFECSIAA